jgi:TolB-like protein/thioredoxin-like negative regulator of GroEL
MAEDLNDPPLLARTWTELRRRKVVRAGIAYALVAWVILQLGEITFEPLGLPGWVMTWTILLAVLGFPVVLVLAWVFDRGDDGLKRDRSGLGGVGPARLFALLVVAITVGVSGWWLSDVYRDADAETVEPAATKSAAAAVASADAAPSNSIAVLPFDDMSPGRDQGWFADGLAEELLDRLARVQGLRVAARTSSFALRERQLDVTGIGQALNVALVVEGSVRKAEGRIRVTVQLIDAGNGYHLWSDSYERPDQGIFDLQDDITSDIVDNLRRRIPGLTQERPGPAARAVVGSADTRDLKAHELYLQGRVLWRQRTPSSLARAAALFEQAIEIDPDYARAWCGLADTRLLLADYGGVSAADAVTLAEPAVVQALTLAPGLGEAWASLGLLRFTAGQLEAAEGNLLEALRLDPNYDMALMWLGGLYGRQGRLNARAEVLERALAMSPLDPAITVNLANNRYAQGDNEGARRLLVDLLAVIPDSNVARVNLATFERNNGRLVESLRHSDLAWRQDPDGPNAIMGLIMSLSALERVDEAERLTARLPSALPMRHWLEFMLQLQRDIQAPLSLELVARLEQVLGRSEPLAAEYQPLLWLGWLSDYRNGRIDRALRSLRKLVEVQGGGLLTTEQLNPAAGLILLLRQSGAEAEAASVHELLQQSVQQAHEQGLSGAATEFGEATLLAVDGDEQGALAKLDKALALGFNERWLIDIDPRLDSLRELPRFRQLRDGLVQRIATQREQSLAVATY